MSQIYLDYLGEIEIDDASYEDYISVIYNILDNIYPIKLCAICDKLITDNDFEKVLIDTDVSKTEVFVCNDCKDSMYCSIDNELLISSIKLTDGTVQIRYDGITTGYLQNGKINSLLYKKYSPEEYIYNYMYPDIAKEEIDYIVCDCTEKIYYVKGDTSKISGVYCPNCGKNVRGTFIEGETNMDKSNSYDIMPYSRSYGIELESARVISPKSIVRTVNFIEVYDGSCDGKEYVSGILRGDNGLADISEFLDSINESAPINKRSGFHVHFGLDDTERLDMELTKVLLLYYSIEQYMFSLLPKSRRDNRYCKSLSDIIGNHSCVSFIDMVNHNGFP